MLKWVSVYISGVGLYFGLVYISVYISGGYVKVGVGYIGVGYISKRGFVKVGVGLYFGLYFVGLYFGWCRFIFRFIFLRLSMVKEVDGVPQANEMINLLTKGHEQVVRTAREVLKLAQSADDESTASLVSDRMRLHEKTSWMLRTLLQ